MTQFIALLKGINVGGHHKIKMEELRKLFGKLGFERVVTYIQSGNVVFNSSVSDQKRLEEQISSQLENHYGFKVPVIVKNISEWQAAIDQMPFSDQDEAKLLITFLQQNPDPALVEQLKQFASPSEELFFHQQFIYLHCPEGYGRTKLSNDLIEKKLKVTATTRNFKSVKKILHLAIEQK